VVDQEAKSLDLLVNLAKTKIQTT